MILSSICGFIGFLGGLDLDGLSGDRPEEAP